MDAQLGRGEFAPLREWLGDNIHRHGRKFPPRELLHRVTGEALPPEPFLAYLRAKLPTSPPDPHGGACAPRPPVRGPDHGGPLRPHRRQRHLQDES